MSIEGKVLVVDDQPLNVKMLAAKLSESGYEVLKAFNGSEAIRLARDGNPDLILLDITMPGMDGYEVTKILKADPATSIIPIVLLTALDAVKDKVKGLNAGADDFLSKPCSPTELLARVRSLVRLKKLQEKLGSMAERGGASASGQSGTAVTENAPILIVEDNALIAKIFNGVLVNAGYRTVVATDGKDALRVLIETRPSLILLDLVLPDMNGIDLLRDIKADPSTEDIVVIIISSLSDLDTKVRGIETGADDYLVKPVDHAELIARVRAALRKNDARQKLQARLETATTQSLTDNLTGLYNRHYLKSAFEREIPISTRYSRTFSVMIIDIDDFKGVNDTFGHLSGDSVLREMGSLIRNNVRASDLAVRYGGEEFVVFLTETALDISLSVAEKLRMAVEAHRFSDVEDRKIKVSIGITEFHPDDAEMGAIIKRADDALYAAKREGRNRVKTSPPSLQPGRQITAVSSETITQNH